MAKSNFHLSIKKLLLLGFLFVVLLAIPLTIYLVQQQQESRTQATKSTTLSFTPPSENAVVGDNLDFNILLSPGTNQVSLVKLIIKFDPTKLSTTEQSFSVNPASQLSILEGPVLGTDTLSVVLSIGGDATKVITTETTIGTISFDVIGGPDPASEISFDPATEIKSSDEGDASLENVFLSGNPATVNITDGSGASVTPSVNPSPTIAVTSGGTNIAPVCSSLNLDVASTGIAPYTVTFNAKGSDSDGDIRRILFTFGNGETDDIASDSATASDTIDISSTHTYQTTGNFTATVVLTDDKNGTSNSVNCSKSITVTDEDGNIAAASDGSESDDDSDSTTSDNSDSDATGGETEDSQTSGTESTTTSTDLTPSPLPATGPEEKIVGFGVLGGILFLIGTLLFFAL